MASIPRSDAILKTPMVEIIPESNRISTIQITNRDVREACRNYSADDDPIVPLTAEQISQAADGINFLLAEAYAPDKLRSFIDSLIGASGGTFDWFEAADIEVGRRTWKETSDLSKDTIEKRVQRARNDLVEWQQESAVTLIETMPGGQRDNIRHKSKYRLANLFSLAIEVDMQARESPTWSKSRKLALSKAAAAVYQDRKFGLLQKPKRDRFKKGKETSASCLKRAATYIDKAVGLAHLENRKTAEIIVVLEDILTRLKEKVGDTPEDENLSQMSANTEETSSLKVDRSVHLQTEPETQLVHTLTIEKSIDKAKSPLGVPMNEFMTHSEAEQKRLRREELERAFSEAMSLDELRRFDPKARERAGESRFCCPLCHGDRRMDERHRSLSANLTSGLWHCNRCEEGGTLREFWKFQPDNNPAPSNRKVTPKPQTPKPENDRWRKWYAEAKPLNETPGAAYLAGRSVSIDMAVQSGVKFSPWYLGGSVLYPIRNAGGELVAFEARAVDSAKALKTNGTDRGTQGAKIRGVFFQPADLEADQIAIVENPLTRLILQACGVAAIAVCGAGNWPEWLTGALAGKQVLLAYDNDEKDPKTGTRPGDEAERKATERLQGTCMVLRFRPSGWKNWLKLAESEGIEETQYQIGETLARWEADTGEI